jgi:hypothetical protein
LKRARIRVTKMLDVPPGPWPPPSRGSAKARRPRRDAAPVYKKVKLWGLGADGRRVGAAEIVALIDPGSMVSIIGKATAKKLGGLVAAAGDRIEGRRVKTMAVEIRCIAPDRGVRPKTIVVDDALVARAAPTAEIIIGRDYLQRTRLDALLVGRRAGRG